MAVAVPLIAAVAAGAVSKGVAAIVGLGIVGTIIGSAAGGLVAFGINSAFGARQRRPEVTPFAAAVTGVTEELVETAAAQVVVIGRMRVAGALCYVAERPNGAQKNGFLYQVHAYAGHRAKAINEIFLGDDPLSDSKFAAVAKAEWKLGTATQSAIDLVVTGTGGEWSPDHRGRGCVMLGTELRYDESIFRGARPVTRASGEWLTDIYDPRTGTTGYTTNVALIVAWFLTARDAAGIPFGYGLDWSDLHEPSLIAAANVCDELVPLKGGGSERRYTANGFFRRDTGRQEVLTKLLEAMAGDAQPGLDGFWRINAGAYKPPTLAIDETWLRDGFEYQRDTPIDQLFSTVRATYLRPEAGWQVVEAPPFTDEAALAEDNGEEETSDLELTFTTSGFTAQRLMRIALRRNRLQGTLLLPCKLHGLTLVLGDTVTVDLPDVPATTWRVRKLTITENVRGVDVVLERWQPSIFTWNPQTDEQPLGDVPGLTVPDGAELAAPTVTVTPPGDAVPASIAVAWSAVAGAASYDVHWRLPDAAAWTETSQAGTSATISTAGRASFRVRARAADNRVGNWRDAPFPPSLTAWGVVGAASGFQVSWTGAARVQVFTSGGTDFAAATKVSTDPTVSPTTITFPAGAVNVWMRPVSAQGVVGASVGPLAVVAEEFGGGDGGSQSPGEGSNGGEGGGADGGGGDGGEGGL